jgi:vacuolar-type H+-ATPase subunit I/STV1
MNLNEELNKLKKFIGNEPDKFDEQLKIIQDNFNSEEELKIIDEFVRDGLSELTSDLKEFNREISLRTQLADVAEIISLSYVSRKYFNKSRSWFHQRINGQKVNGKSVKFTHSEIEILKNALQDISKKIGSIAIHS